MFFNNILQFTEIYNWLPTSWWSSNPGSLSDEPQEPRLTGSLGCSRSLLAARADASIMDDHGWGILDIIMLRKSPVNVMGIVLFAVDEIWYMWFCLDENCTIILIDSFWPAKLLWSNGARSDCSHVGLCDAQYEAINESLDQPVCEEVGTVFRILATF